jgi:hypothetical protein
MGQFMKAQVDHFWRAPKSHSLSEAERLSRLIVIEQNRHAIAREVN